jgi:ADP-ribosylglycohydrolase
MTETTERIYGTIIGAAIGDALGAPLEFLQSRPEHLFVRDMVGAVAGSLLGAFHGAEAIPQRWIDKLEKLDELTEFCCSCSLKMSLLKTSD